MGPACRTEMACWAYSYLPVQFLALETVWRGRRMMSSELKLKQPHKFFPLRLFDFTDTTEA